MLSATHSNTYVVVAWLAELLHQRFGLVDAHQVRLVLLAGALAFDAVLDAAYANSAQGDPSLIEFAFVGLRSILRRLPTTNTSTTGDGADD